MPNRTPLWLAIALFSTGCTTMDAQIRSSGTMGPSDAAFANTAYELVQLDNQAGVMAPAKARDPRIVDLSSRLTAQAGVLTPGLQAALNAEGIKPPSTMSPATAAMVDKLRGLSGSAFDKEFVADELAVHKRAVAAFQQEDQTTKDGAIRSQVETELPAVQDNLNSLQALSSEFNPTQG